MNVVGVAGLLLALIVIPALLVGLVVWWVRRVRSDDGGAPAHTARQHEHLVSTVAVLAGALTTVALIYWSPPWLGTTVERGVYLSLIPFAVAVAVALVRSAGELTWPRPRGQVRAAPLVRRTPWAVGGTRLRWVLGTAAALAAVLTVTGIAADATGHTVTSGQAILANGDTISASAGPFPGWHYGAPMLLALAAVLAVTVVALGAITRRAPLHGLPDAHDDAIRRTSAGRLLAVVQLGLGVPLGGVLFIAGSAVTSLGHNLHLNDGEPGAYVGLGRAITAVGVAVILAAIITATAALWPRLIPRADVAPLPQTTA